MNTKNKIGIHFVGLTPKETALFERVVSFNVTHGLKANIESDITNADLIIVTTELFASVENNHSDKTVAVIVNDETNTQGDVQLSRPLMITKVMSSLTEVIKLADEKINTAPKSESSKLIDVNIVDANADINVQAKTDTNISSPERVIEETPAVKIIEEQKESKKHHALIIDDSASIRKQLELELRDAGITSDYAECGEDALEKIKDNHFDLVFLDIIMPGLDGYDTCKAMRATPAYKKTPIIMLSGKTAPLDEVKGVIAGATTYLTKPVKSDKLQETLIRVTKWIENFAPPRQKESV